MNTKTKTVAISILGTILDKRGKGEKRWSKWRPTVSMCQHEDLLIDRMELLFQPDHQALADQVRSLYSFTGTYFTHRSDRCR